MTSTGEDREKDQINILHEVRGKFDYQTENISHVVSSPVKRKAMISSTNTSSLRMFHNLKKTYLYATLSPSDLLKLSYSFYPD